MDRKDLGAEFDYAVQLADAGWLDLLPDEPGLYVAVLGRQFAGLKGETDILYIGRASKLVNGEPATIRRRWKNRWGFPTYNEKALRDVFRILLDESETIALLCARARGWPWTRFLEKKPSYSTSSSRITQSCRLSIGLNPR